MTVARSRRRYLIATVILASLALAMWTMWRWQSRPVDTSMVQAALAGGLGSDRVQSQVIRAGDSAIPLIFQCLREKKKTELTPRVLYNSLYLIRRMAEAKTIDLSAPCIRKVLLDTQEPSVVVDRAALMSYWLQNNPAVRADLFRCTSFQLTSRVGYTCKFVLSAGMGTKVPPTGKAVKAILDGRYADLNSFVVVGEVAIPLILDAVRAKPGDPKISYLVYWQHYVYA